MREWYLSVGAELGSFSLELECGGGVAPVVVIGPNGCGKTTLLRVIAGGVEALKGEIVIGNRTVFSRSRGISLGPEERGVGYLPQGYALFPHLRVIDNVAFGLRFGKAQTGRAESYRLARAVLADLECEQLAHRRPIELSGGERQRVALARALVIKPKLLLLDEPLAAMDVGSRRRVRCFLAERLLDWKIPALVVTHDMRDVVALAAHVIVLDKGRIVQRGSLEELRAAPVNDFVAEFSASVSQSPGLQPATKHALALE